MTTKPLERRRFLSALAASASAVELFAQNPPLTLCVFTKHLQFLNGDRLVEAIAEIGVEGADVSLRHGGHIEPARAQQDLPPLIRALAERNLRLTMATTDIVDLRSPFAETVLQTLSSQGVRYYRWGGFKFDPLQPIVEQIEALKPRVAQLAEFNRKLDLCAMYHTHSGLNQIGPAIWDLHLLLKDFDPRHVAVNYDIGHATIEGGLGGWIESLNVTGPYLRGVALKDVMWQRDSDGGWRPQWCPAGEGMVRFNHFFSTLQRLKFKGPAQVHFEYPLGGAESGTRDITIPKDQILAAMKRDIIKLRALWSAAQRPATA